MSRGGHNKKPTILKLTHGTFREDRANEKEPEVKALDEAPKAPSHLNTFAKNKWKELAPVLAQTRVLSATDLTMLEALCEAYGQYREAQYAVYHYTDDDGKKRKRNLAQYMSGKNSQTMPEYTAMRQALSMVKTISAEFGLSPATRSRVSAIDTPEAKDPMEALLEGAG
ncbi:phage terminase small subunit P27 family [Sediminispirochaeta smaragdinae]|uniref:Phage terminase, small subunit, P27 family n=1 Tax=Sediminispirochaeta smaragdinae (strain DSM 11293 / JCM 15392 / SEBR 4228) TaxID=573413 RepID=E1R6X9_SEDSS|nr:phage terminase small subunit P27 family [Sediminispirochaeta smaragdinae]ADK81306.1 phage terminase, small subunit, P27 family [Sediminispirochaeta smaragdinae DSM 11293]